MIVVQQIRTVWTKASRGGEAAALRNAVPETARVAIGHDAGAGLQVLLHQLFFHEANGFIEPAEKIVENLDSDPLRIGCVTIDHVDEQVRAVFSYSRECGAPDRGWMRKTLVLTLNEWDQIVYNGRFAGEYGWWYEKVVINVGLFERPSSGVFTQTEPAYRYSAMAHLL